MEPTPTSEPEPTFTPSNPDPRRWTQSDVIAGLNMLPIPESEAFIGRANRHDPTSEIKTVTIKCAGSLSFEAITMIAGLFETPHISFTPAFRTVDGSPNADCTDVPCGCVECVEPYTCIVVMWEALPPISKRGNVEVPR